MLTLQERQNFTVTLPHCRVSKISPDLRGHTFPCDVVGDREGDGRGKKGGGGMNYLQLKHATDENQKKKNDK